MLYQKRKLDLEGRLNQREADKQRIKFDRLPRKKTKSIWWLIALFFVVLYLFYFLKNL